MACADGEDAHSFAATMAASARRQQWYLSAQAIGGPSYLKSRADIEYFKWAPRCSYASKEPFTARHYRCTVMSSLTGHVCLIRYRRRAANDDSVHLVGILGKKRRRTKRSMHAGIRRRRINSSTRSQRGNCIRIRSSIKTGCNDDWRPMQDGRAWACHAVTRCRGAGRIGWHGNP